MICADSIGSYRAILTELQCYARSVLFTGIDAGHEDLLGLECDFAPLGIWLTTQHKLTEVAEEAGFL